MGEKMTLEQVRDDLRRFYGQDKRATWMRDMADAIDAHLTQPAQAADVGAIREVIWHLRKYDPRADQNAGKYVHTYWADKLTAALPNANGKEGVGRDFTEEVDVDGKATGYLIFEHTTPPMLPDEVRKAVEEIDCLYCCRPGTRLNVHKGGWQLAKNRPFAYVCPDCTHRETAHLSENSRG